MQDFSSSHWCSWRCKPFSLWRDIAYIMGLFDSPLCRRCGAEEETAHVPCECKALTSFRHTYLGSFFMDPEDVMSLILGAIKNLSKGTGLPWLWHQILGHKGLVQKRPTCTETKRTQTHLLFCFILFRMWRCVIVQTVRVPSYYELSSRRRIVGKAAAPVIARLLRRLVWIFSCIISVTHVNSSELYVKCMLPSALLYYHTLEQILGCISPLDRSSGSYFLKKETSL